MSAAIQTLQSEFCARAAADADVVRTGESMHLAGWLHAQLASAGGNACVPSLNAIRADQVAEGALVRFCGMIQDVRDPEFYNGTYEVVGADGVAHLRTTKYQGDIVEPPEAQLRMRSNEVWQRVPAVCVPIPARSSWMQDAVVGAQASPPPSSSAAAAAAAARSGKRAADDAEDGAAAGTAAVDASDAMDEDEAPKRACAPADGDACVPCEGGGGGGGGGGVDGASSSSSTVGAGAAASFAARAAAAADGSVLLKLYDVPEAEELKVHELVEVYGLLERASEDLDIAASALDDDDMLSPMATTATTQGGASAGGKSGGGGGGGGVPGLLALQAEAERKQRPPPSAQPRLHVLAFRRLPDAHTPILPEPIAAGAPFPWFTTPSAPVAADGTSAAAAPAAATPPAAAPAAAPTASPCGAVDEASLAEARAQAPALRAALLSGLCTALGGDALAAEYVLLSVTSRVISRHAEMPVGKLHLNLSGCPSPSSGAAPSSPVAGALHAALSELLPLCLHQPLTIPGLNAGGLLPVKDHEANCIWPSSLQVPNGATLIVDEALMAPGQLSDPGVKGLAALHKLAEQSKLPYDFTYFQVDFPLDTTLVSVSTSPSVLPLKCTVPLRVTPMPPPPPPETATPQWKHAARRYLGLVTRLQHSISGMGEAGLAKRAQDDFVAARQADSKVGADDFARWLTTARLVAASALSPTVEMGHYEHAMRLEAERVERLRKPAVEI